ncbi:MAG: hypothetical protein ACFFAX_01635 [Promethearchaeota archaeon]
MSTRSDKILALVFLIVGLILSCLGWLILGLRFLPGIMAYVFICSVMILIFVVWALKGRPPWPYIP